MKKRLEFKCWHCDKTYSLLREIGEGNPQLSVACPFCSKEAIVELDPFRKPLDTIYRTDSPHTITVGETVYDLPEILPTEPKS